MWSLLGPAEYHDHEEVCLYKIFWPCQKGFLFQEQVYMTHTVNGSQENRTVEST